MILLVPADFATIADAVATASDGDTVVVAAGTWTEDLDLGGKSLTIGGAGSGSTVLAASGTGILAEGGTVVLSGLTIRGGERGIDSAADLTLTDVLLADVGDGSDDGAALRQVGGSLTWTGGGVDYGLADEGTVRLESTTAVLDTIDLQFNVARSGAGLHATDSDVTLTTVAIAGNEATASGGGAWVSGGSFWIDGGGAFGNSAGDGGGCFAVEDAAVTLTGATVEQCVATQVGGALRQRGGTLTIEASAFTDDEAHASADLYVADADAVWISETTFDDGAASSDEWTGAGEATIEAATSVALGAAAITLDGVSWSGLPPTWLGVRAEADGALVLGDLALGASSGVSTAWLFGDVLTASGTWTLADVAIVGRGASVGAGPLDISGGSLSLGSTGYGSVNGLSTDGTDLTLWDLAATDITVVDGALIVEDSTVSVDGLRLRRGQLDLSGGGAQVSIFDGVVEGGTDTCIFVAYGSVLQADGLSVSGCSGTYGGALRVAQGGDVTLHQAFFGGNSAGAGGAISMESGSLVATASVFVGNTAGTGGAVRVTGGDANFQNVVFQGNTATDGAAVYVDGAYPTIWNATAVDNEATSFAGAFHVRSGYLALVGSIVAYGPDGAGLYTNDASAAAWSTVEYDDVWDNAGGGYGGVFADPTGTEGNLAEDPLFVAWADDGDQRGDDLHLLAGSPCLDAGYPGWSDPDGTVSDMGAYGGLYADQIDYDGDLVLASEGDCDDSDASTWPGAVEVAYDGADNDCAGDGDLTDVDGDGANGGTGGADCDDENAAVYPGAADVAEDGVDQDCDGVDGGADTGDSGDSGGDQGDTAVDSGADSGGETGAESGEEPGDTAEDSGAAAGGAGCRCDGGAGRATLFLPLLWVRRRRSRAGRRGA